MTTRPTRTRKPVGRLTLAAVLVAVAALGAARPLSPGRHPISGRTIAPVMGHEGADWLDRPEREAEERPATAVRALRLQPGQVVADVGAGSGYFTVRLSDAVGPDGRVYATDIQPEMLARLDDRLRRRKITNVTTVLGTADEPKLPPGALDLILMVDVYHELAEPQAFVRRLRAALKPGGRLVLIEYRKEDPSVPIREEHKMSVAEARAELEAEGFRLERVLNDLPRQHILVFSPA